MFFVVVFAGGWGGVGQRHKVLLQHSHLCVLLMLGPLRTSVSTSLPCLTLLQRHEPHYNSPHLSLVHITMQIHITGYRKSQGRKCRGTLLCIPDSVEENTEAQRKERTPTQSQGLLHRAVIGPLGFILRNDTVSASIPVSSGVL